MHAVLRRSLLSLHRWTGMVVAPAVAAMAVTGSTLLLRPHLETVVDPWPEAVATCQAHLPLDRLVESARSRHPTGAIRQIELHAGSVEPVVVRYTDLQGVHVDACDGRVLGVQDRWAGVFGTLEWLHRWRFVGNTDISELIAGSLSIVLALMVATGLVVWWPRSKAMLKRTLAVRSSLKGAAFGMHLHRVAGVYAAVVLLSTALAAWTFTFGWARAGLYAITLSAAPASKPVSSAVPSDATASTLEALLVCTLQAVPQADRITLVLPRKPRDPVEVQVIERDAPHPNARSVVYLDRNTAQVLRAEPYATSSAGHKAYRWLASLHMGYVGGVPGQLVQAVAMWMVPFLLFTGIRSHLRKRRSSAR